MKYAYNTEVFTNDDDTSYYLLGAFITDGSLNKYRAYLSSKDEDWLKTIRDLVCPNKPIYKDKLCFRLSLNNKIIVNWLLTRGVIPNKSLTVDFPIIPDKYLADFIRGVIDGDGTIAHKQYKRYRNKNNKPYLFYSTHYALSSASLKFVNGFSNILTNKNLKHSVLTSLAGTHNSKIDGRVIRHKNNCYCVTGGHGSAFKFLNWVYYSGHKISLDRKNVIAQKIISDYKSKL